MLTRFPNKRSSLSVAVVIASLSNRAGGLAASVSAGVNAVTRRGIDAHVFGLRDAGLDLESLPYEQASVHPIPDLPFPGMRLAPALDRALAGVWAEVLQQTQARAVQETAILTSRT